MRVALIIVPPSDDTDRGVTLVTTESTVGENMRRQRDPVFPPDVTETFATLLPRVSATGVENKTIVSVVLMAITCAWYRVISRYPRKIS